jgi:PcfJ-like protein
MIHPRYLGMWRKLAIRRVNGMITRLLGHADPDALRIARRYSAPFRWGIYLACLRSRNARQLCETFPFLAALLYTEALNMNVMRQLVDPVKKKGISAELFPLESIHVELESDRPPCIQTAIQQVEHGAKLRDIAQTVRVPMWFRDVRPGAVGHLINVLNAYSEYGVGLEHRLEPAMDTWVDKRVWDTYLPSTLSAQRRALTAMGWSIRQHGVPSTVLTRTNWVLKWAHQLEGPARAIGPAIGEIIDWHRGTGSPLRPELSYIRAKQECNLWHRTAVKWVSIDHQLQFPPPPLPSLTKEGWEITYISTGAELQEEAEHMRHCVASYATMAHKGQCALYSVRKKGKRVATVEIDTIVEGLPVKQIKGPFNADPAADVKRLVSSWAKQKYPMKGVDHGL